MKVLVVIAKIAGIESTAKTRSVTSTTINTSTLLLRDAANAPVAGTVTYNNGTRTATFNPTPTLTLGALYTATIRGGSADPRAKDAAGVPLAGDVVVSFRIVSDTTPPTVSSTSPAANANLVSRTANVTATFSEAMDAASISGATFELRTASSVVVPAVVSYNSSTRVATLNPNATLAARSVYTLRVRGGASGVKDLAGNALAADLVRSFTTGS